MKGSPKLRVIALTKAQHELLKTCMQLALDQTGCWDWSQEETEQEVDAIKALQKHLLSAFLKHETVPTMKACPTHGDRWVTEGVCTRCRELI